MTSKRQSAAEAVGGIVALGGYLVFTMAVLGLHALRPDLEPTTVALSYYVHGPHGALLTLALVSLGAGSLALGLVLRAALVGRGARVVRWGVWLWGASVVAAAAFPADPMGQWSRPSLPGMIHGAVAMVGFLALPVAALALARASQEDARWQGAAGHLTPLACACVVALLVFFASLWPTLGAERPPVLLGLSERVLLVVYVTWLSASAVRALRLAGARA